MPAATDAHAAARPKKEEKSWTCPYCELQIIQDPEARADQLSRKRLHHIRTAHPDKPQPNVCKRRQAIEASNALPDTLKAWVCPICYAALPELEERLKHDSICKHITDHHPKETLRSLNSKQARAKLPPWHRKDQTLGAKQQKRLHDAAIKTAKQHGHLPAIAPDDTMGSQYMPDKTQLHKKFPAGILILLPTMLATITRSNRTQQTMPKANRHPCTPPHMVDKMQEQRRRQ